MLCFVSSLLVIVITTLMPSATMELTTDNNCTQLEFFNVKDDIIHTTVGRDINVTFSLRFENCSTNDSLLVKILKKSKNNIIHKIECTIIYNQSMCTVTTATFACNCTSATAPATFITKVSEAGNTTYAWTWRHNTSVENERTVTVVVSEDDSMTFSFNMIILGSILGSLAVITVASVTCIVFYQKSAYRNNKTRMTRRVRNCQRKCVVHYRVTLRTLEIKKVRKSLKPSPRAPKWSGDARNPSGQGQGLVSKKQLSMGQYQEVHDSLFHPKSEKNLYTNRSRPRRDTSRHNMSQDRADLIRQSSGSVYGQVYDALMLQTATADTSHQPRPANKS